MENIKEIRVNKLVRNTNLTIEDLESAFGIEKGQLNPNQKLMFKVFENVNQETKEEEPKEKELNTYEILREMLEEIRIKKAELGYSNGYTIVKGIRIEQLNFEDCLLLSTRLNDYEKAYKEQRPTEDPMLSNHKVEYIKKQLGKRFEYLELIKEGSAIERLINNVKNIQEMNKKINAMKACIHFHKKEMSETFEKIGLKAELKF
jgi:hypothetical protein